MNKDVTESPVWLRTMASPNRSAMDRVLILGQFRPFSDRGMVSVTKTDFKGEALIRSMAGPDSTGWVQQAWISEAPFSARALAASVKVPAVSAMSSKIITRLADTLPITAMALALFGASRRLSMRPRVATRRLA